ncbi:MAG: 50S ribosomal protein L6 [Vulcanimicrobiota bacterium]
MSRVGNAPVEIPKGVTVEMEGQKIIAKGSKGQLEYLVPDNFNIKIEDNILTVERPGDSRQERSLHGLARNLIRNMVVGVSQGYEKTLEIVGVGYKAAKQGASVQLNVGYSHPLVFKEGDGIEFDVPNQTTVVVKGIDKQKVGQMAANIRGVRPPEPYKGKGIRYQGEYVRRKVGKAGA